MNSRRDTERKHYCNNCGNTGHSFNRCMEPITSLGVITYRYNPKRNAFEYIMINRKDSLGFVDLIRGKYNVHNIMYLRNIINEMTLNEKDMILNKPFEDLWAYMWNFRNISNRYKNEYDHSYKKYMFLKQGIDTTHGIYRLSDLIQDSDTKWCEPEWGFPKGRRNYKESDIHTAMREFEEETGIRCKHIQILKNVSTFDENFTGSNYKSYRSRYFVAHMPYNENIEFCKQDCEVSRIGWFTIDECMMKIRDNHQEKKDILDRIHKMICTHTIV
jgi:8-oxo-dGTP pyrophosphatase MutT (NUDIX family)